MELTWDEVEGRMTDAERKVVDVLAPKREIFNKRWGPPRIAVRFPIFEFAKEVPPEAHEVLELAQDILKALDLR